MLTGLDMHDALLMDAPQGARHDSDVCPFCTDWALTESGTPSGFARLDSAAQLAPYGENVEYADPGYQSDGVKRYPLDTPAHTQAAWTFIHTAPVAEKYADDELTKMRVAVAQAMEKHQLDADEDEIKKTKALAEAKNAGKPVPGQGGAGGPSGSSKKSSSGAKPDRASEGGKPHMDEKDMISKETHDALLDKAVRDAQAAWEAEKAGLTAKVEELTPKVETLTTENASLKSENERLNGELDTAQVSLKAATDEVASLKSDIAAAADKAARDEVASTRVAQVKELGLFTEEYIADKASKWSEMDDEAWADRVDEWSKLKAAAPATTTSTDTASAMTGTRDAGTGHQPSARRQVLGLAPAPAQSA
jgi:regulator of replication initiation timing